MADDKKQNGPERTPPPTVREAPAPEVSFRVEIDVANRITGLGTNGRHFFPPLRRELRSRWKRQNIPAGSMPDELQTFPDIPGILIIVESRRIAVVDPLQDPANERMVELLKTVVKGVDGAGGRPEDTVRIDSPSGDQLKNYCYWCRRMLDNHDCTLVAGRVPSIEEIDFMPGSMEYQISDGGSKVSRSRTQHAEGVAAGRKYLAPPRSANSTIESVPLENIKV